VEISQFPKLRQITVSSFPVSVRAIEAIAQMTTLRSLDLRGAQISDDAFEKLELLKDAHPDLKIMF
jgi:hypothetical protein